MRTRLKAAELWDGERLHRDPTIEVEDGRIVSLSTNASGDAGENPSNNETAVYEFAGATLAPAFFDVHIHGAAGHDVMEATPEAQGAIGAFLARHGTGSYLATTVTASVDATLRALDGLARLIEHPEAIDTAKPAALPIGIHLEGPFLSEAKCGAQPKEHLQKPDIALFDRFYEAAGGHLRLMTLAPELPGAPELTAHATARGVRVSLGHSNATAAETLAAIAAGAVSATHTFNAMRPLTHQEPGILGTVLLEDSLYAEMICDGVHSAPAMAKLFWKAKGAQRGILITDAMSAAGMPDGEYRLGNFQVQVADGRAMIHGVLAGSVLTLDRALSNFVSFTGATVVETLALLTTNPAEMTGYPGVGRIAVGGAAHLVAVDQAGRLIASIRDGVPIES